MYKLLSLGDHGSVLLMRLGSTEVFMRQSMGALGSSKHAHDCWPPLSPLTFCLPRAGSHYGFMCDDNLYQYL